MYKQFLKILQKSDDIYLFFLCENMSFNLGMNSTDTLYVFDFDSAPPWALVVTEGTCPSPIPQLSSLARLAIGESSLSQMNEDDVPSCVRRTSFKFVVNKYVCNVCRTELP